MKALILNDRVVDVVETEFEVPSTMTWMDAPSDCVSGRWILDESGVLIEETIITSFTAEQRLREIRNQLLTESDWTQANDASLTPSKVAKWKTYRQELRDLPANSTPELEANGTLTGVTWPTKPE